RARGGGRAAAGAPPPPLGHLGQFPGPRTAQVLAGPVLGRRQQGIAGGVARPGAQALRDDQQCGVVGPQRPYLAGHLRLVKPHPRLASAPCRSAHPRACPANPWPAARPPDGRLAASSSSPIPPPWAPPPPCDPPPASPSPFMRPLATAKIYGTRP